MGRADDISKSVPQTFVPPRGVYDRMANGSVFETFSKHFDSQNYNGLRLPLELCMDAFKSVVRCHWIHGVGEALTLSLLRVNSLNSSNKHSLVGLFARVAGVKDGVIILVALIPVSKLFDKIDFMQEIIVPMMARLESGVNVQHRGLMACRCACVESAHACV